MRLLRYAIVYGSKRDDLICEFLTKKEAMRHLAFANDVAETIQLQHRYFILKWSWVRNRWEVCDD